MYMTSYACMCRLCLYVSYKYILFTLTVNGSYPCQDTHRTHSFDSYYKCLCAGGWTGQYCDVDIDECLSDPCLSPYVCFNNENFFECACPVDNPHCEFELYLIAIIVLAGVLLIILICTGIYRYKRKKRSEQALKKLNKHQRVLKSIMFCYFKSLGGFYVSLLMVYFIMVSLNFCLLYQHKIS